MNLVLIIVKSAHHVFNEHMIAEEVAQQEPDREYCLPEPTNKRKPIPDVSDTSLKEMSLGIFPEIYTQQSAVLTINHSEGVLYIFYSVELDLFHCCQE